jgi:hypothetical protein
MWTRVGGFNIGGWYYFEGPSSIDRWEGYPLKARHRPVVGCTACDFDSWLLGSNLLDHGQTPQSPRPLFDTAREQGDKKHPLAPTADGSIKELRPRADKPLMQLASVGSGLTARGYDVQFISSHSIRASGAMSIKLNASMTRVFNYSVGGHLTPSKSISDHKPATSPRASRSAHDS